MIRRFMFLVITCAACQGEAPALSETASPVPTPVFVPRPLIRYDDFEGEADKSGMKLMRPEILERMFLTSFGVVPESYRLYLGGLDYENVTSRSEVVTPTMPLVMFKLADGACDQILATA